MLELSAAAVTALWLGILTSVSPCPLATNIVAVSYIGRNVAGARPVLRTSLMYAAGRTVAYVLLAALLVFGLLAAPVTSHALQKWMIRALGPFLLVTAVVLAGWIRIPWPSGGIAEDAQRRIAGRGTAGALLLGFLFALTFCPVSAALFFGALLPVAVETRSPVLLPLSYGIGTAIPVIAVAGAIAAGAGQVGRVFDQAARVDAWARRITAIVFAAVGLWFTVRYTIGW